MAETDVGNQTRYPGALCLGSREVFQAFPFPLADYL